MSDFIPTVNLSLKDYQNLIADRDDKHDRLVKINKALKAVHKYEIEDLMRFYRQIQDSDNARFVRDAVYKGKL